MIIIIMIVSCQFVFCPSWKPIQEETRQNWEKTSSYARNLKLNVKVNRSQTEPEPVPENEKCKIFQDLAIQTDKEIEHRRRDIVIIDKEVRECKINDIAVPRNRKNYQYQDLRLQAQNLWKVKATVITVITGALEQFVRNLRTISKPLEYPQL